MVTVLYPVYFTLLKCKHLPHALNMQLLDLV